MVLGEQDWLFRLSATGLHHQPWRRSIETLTLLRATGTPGTTRRAQGGSAVHAALRRSCLHAVGVRTPLG